MTTGKVAVKHCQWFHQMRDTNVCLISSYDIPDATKIKYCLGDWHECEFFQLERKRVPIRREDIDAMHKKSLETK